MVNKILNFHQIMKKRALLFQKALFHLKSFLFWPNNQVKLTFWEQSQTTSYSTLPQNSICLSIWISLTQFFSFGEIPQLLSLERIKIHGRNVKFKLLKKIKSLLLGDDQVVAVFTKTLETLCFHSWILLKHLNLLTLRQWIMTFYFQLWKMIWGYMQKPVEEMTLLSHKKMESIERSLGPHTSLSLVITKLEKAGSLCIMEQCFWTWSSVP